jgi:hypothetical protein
MSSKSTKAEPLPIRHLAVEGSPDESKVVARHIDSGEVPLDMECV